MKNVVLVVLIVLIGYLADRVVRLENQRYALTLGMCRHDPANMAEKFGCLDNVQTRTAWGWHLFYAMTDSLPPVPLFK
jgi:hypothetical protein